MTTDDVIALVELYGYRAQLFTGDSGWRKLNVWPLSHRSYLDHEELVIGLLTLSGITLIERRGIYVELGGPAHPALLVFTHPLNP